MLDKGDTINETTLPLCERGFSCLKIQEFLTIHICLQAMMNTSMKKGLPKFLLAFATTVCRSSFV
jgi:hypothetical protein